MPRLIPKFIGGGEKLVVAVEDVPDLSSGNHNRTGWLVYHGQCLPADDPRVQRHPSAFEPAPTDVRFGPAPGPDEAAAVAQVTFIDSGRMVSPGRRFHAYDLLVREHPEFFLVAAPSR